MMNTWKCPICEKTNGGVGGLCWNWKNHPGFKDLPEQYSLVKRKSDGALLMITGVTPHFGPGIRAMFDYVYYCPTGGSIGSFSDDLLASEYIPQSVLSPVHLPIKVFLDYEIHSSKWASFVSWNWMQELSGRYFAWKVKRKYARYQLSKAREFQIKNIQQ